MKQAIEDNGGNTALDGALNLLNNNPIAKFALNKLGLNVDKMTDELKQTSKTLNKKQFTKASESLKDRLKKL